MEENIFSGESFTGTMVKRIGCDAKWLKNGGKNNGIKRLW